jgi:hypothetical protein
MSVTVLDESGNILDPCTERRARILLDRNRASVVNRNPFTIRLINEVSGVTMDMQENLVEIKPSELQKSIEAIGDPIPSWMFDLFIDDKPLWLAIKVKVEDGKIHIRQVLNDKDGIYDLRGKSVRVVYYTSAPSILMEVEFSLGKLSDVNLSCDASGTEGCAEVEAVYECKFVSMTSHCEKISALKAKNHG